jgi:hypothetical protein
MTTTTSPAQVDADLADAHAARETAAAARRSALDSIHRLVGDERPAPRYVGRRRIVGDFKLTDAEVLYKARTEGAAKSWDQASLERTLQVLAAAGDAIDAANVRIDAGQAAYLAAGGWTRFFLVQAGHIHSSMHCSTCNNGVGMTTFGWLTDLSGRTEADVVAEHGALLCTVCFPSAPVEWTNGRELEAAAKAAAQCQGSGTYDWEKAAKDAGEKPRYGRRYQTCPHCAQSISITSTGKLRAHKPKGA